MYKDLEIWHDSVHLIKRVYKVIDDLPKSEEYNLKTQMRRAVVAVSLNIAEGKTRQTAKDFAHFLNVAVSSLAEVEACLSISEALGFIQEDTLLHEECNILSYRINALKNKIMQREGVSNG